MPTRFLIRMIAGCLLALLLACEYTSPPALPAGRATGVPADSLVARAKRWVNGSLDSLKVAADALQERALADKDTNLLVSAHLYQAHYSWRSGHYEGAMSLALSALKEAERRQLLKQLVALYRLIGNLHKEKNNYPMAFAAIDKGMAVVVTLRDTSELITQKRMKAMFTQGYGSLYGDEKIRAQSLALHLEGLQLAESSPKYERERIAYYSNISQYYVYAKEYDRTIYYGEKGIALAHKYQQPRSHTYSYNWVGMAWFLKGQRAKGEAYMLLAARIARDLKWVFREYEVYDSMHECYSAVGDYRQALAYYRRFRDMQDSLKVLDNVTQISQLEIEYQTKKKDDAISNLHSVNEATNRQVTWMWFSLGLMGLLLVIFWWLYRTIRLKNGKIEEQAKKLSVLMRELHHRVKNNLQIVTNLLSLQANRLTDPESIQTIKVGQQRIEAMALIHRSLYEQSNPKSVNMQRYVTDLVAGIQQTFGTEGERVAVQLGLEVEELDVDVALPLGLLINEWVTNAFKHAWLQVERPVLELLMKNNEKELILEIKDNGPGIPESVWQQPQRSFGLKLVKVLIKQLDAVARFSSEKGAALVLQVPLPSLQNIA